MRAVVTAEVEVAVLHWPAEAEERWRLAHEGRVRLLLVAAQAASPEVSDPLEDWVRLPASDSDIEARLRGLAARRRRLEAGSSAPEGVGPPMVDDDGRIHLGAQWIALSNTEAAMMTALVEAAGAVVSREALAEAAWGDERPSRNVLDVHMVRLRRRIEPLGLVIRTVRGRGYVLVGPELSDSCQVPVSET